MQIQTPTLFASEPGTIGPPAPGKSWAEVPLADIPLDQWVEQFHRDGFLFVQNMITPETAARLRDELDRAYVEQVGNGGDGPFRVLRRMFEFSPANLALFEQEPTVSFAEKLVAPDCHVIHNNSFATPKSHGISGWHSDDAPHFLVTGGESPTNIRLPVLWFTANYYLTDVESVEQGATQLIKRSHLIGKPCPADPHLEHAASNFNCIGPAGSVIMFNNQVWHRGATNHTDRVRKITQVTYGRRMINHMFYPFMNYVMPEHCYRDASPRLKRLLGFLPSGAYG
jgi:hypothetical protein